MVSSRGFPQQAHHVAEHRLDLYHLYLCRLPCSHSMGNVTQYEDIAFAPRNRRRLIQLLNSFSQIKIITSHDLDMILNTCERTILLSNGKIVCDGATKEILTNRQVLEKHGLELPLCLQKITK